MTRLHQQTFVLESIQKRKLTLICFSASLKKEIETFNARNYLESKLTHETNLSILDLELSRWLSALWVTSMDLIVKKKSPIVAPVNKMMRGF
ncbi:uncharacterized protein OCT59_021711 [Rhizophagus irregularis]|uniref:Uncharacterized protein n=1 Tax=Rhizophagus irregularis TaxID=588596 RepID=A0A915ZGQ2_9GLOM|nr:hypothetical protein OCT59_021711 [Rhizophagus irregularis]CAB4490707.1 unnamed protein product [Rhizophagus irregularis]CAB5192656.1 unnamed protein product [Rhizophagus irregularis]CAB5376527.1 unnamed protein product [Rhizophagus irregularis]